MKCRTHSRFFVCGVRDSRFIVEVKCMMHTNYVEFYSMLQLHISVQSNDVRNGISRTLCITGKFNESTVD